MMRHNNRTKYARRSPVLEQKKKKKKTCTSMLAYSFGPPYMTLVRDRKALNETYFTHTLAESDRLKLIKSK